MIDGAVLLISDGYKLYVRTPSSKTGRAVEEPPLARSKRLTITVNTDSVAPFVSTRRVFVEYLGIEGNDFFRN